MNRIIVSSQSRVPELTARFEPDAMLSIAARPGIDPKSHPARYLFLCFADIDKPSERNRSLAATAHDIDAIRSLNACDTLLIHCQQGHRRSPSAALILLNTLAPGHPDHQAEWILSLAPYVNFNAWMLKLAGITFPPALQTRNRVVPPRRAFFVLDLAHAPGLAADQPQPDQHLNQARRRQ